MDVRAEIRRDATYRTENPDPEFVKLYRHDNASQEFYDALFTLLEKTGFKEFEVVSVMMDKVPEAGNNMTRSAAVRKYVQLVESAAESVYKTKSSYLSQ